MKELQTNKYLGLKQNEINNFSIYSRPCVNKYLNPKHKHQEIETGKQDSLPVWYFTFKCKGSTSFPAYKDNNHTSYETNAFDSSLRFWKLGKKSYCHCIWNQI
jgi:hypothetical protein